MSARPTPHSRAAAFKYAHPEWADLAYEVLYRRGQHGAPDLQYVVAQAMMAAFEMGQRGMQPPRPKNMEPRKYDEPAPDPEVDAIYQELRMLAWSPLAGTPRPEGYVRWSMSRYFAQKEAQAAPPPPPAPVLVSRRRPMPSAQEPAPAPVVIRRRR